MYWRSTCHLETRLPSEDEIEAKQAYLQALLKKMGKAKWCQLSDARNGRSADHRGNAGARGPVRGFDVEYQIGGKRGGAFTSV